LDAIDECWDESVYDENCPPEKYDYEANGEVEPENIDPDSVPEWSEDGLTYRQKMFKITTEEFKEGWWEKFSHSTEPSNK
jgi:hypothetical protein